MLPKNSTKIQHISRWCLQADTNINNKEKYLLHYRNLQLYLSLGLKLTKIHRVLQVTQSTRLKSYIDLNTVKRTVAKNSFEKDFFKLMNNSVFCDRKCTRTLKITTIITRPLRSSEKNVIKQDLQHDDYRSTLFNSEQIFHTMRTIRSDNHNIGSYEINKISLSRFDDKRYRRKDGVRSYTYGHRKIVC